MEYYDIQTILLKKLDFKEIHVSGDKNHFHIIAVSEVFNGMNQVKRQQIIYAPLIEHIMDNHIHAVSIKAYTPKEWQCVKLNKEASNTKE